jgi:scyllo-inositol 2-dehydrogenase (NADP+)
MADREIGVGLIGYGLGGRIFHAPFISAVPGLRLVSVVERTGDEAAKAYPAVRIVRSVEELLDDRYVELVVVSTPNQTHSSLAKQALEAGKHVVVDKPFATSSEQARELAEVAQRKGLYVVPFQNRRWDGDFLTVRKVLAGGELGRLVTFKSHLDRFRPIPRENSWKETGSPANGMLFDLGPHLIDQVLSLFGVPAAITASVRSDRDDTAIEDGFDIALRYPGTGSKELLVHCGATYLACIPAPRFLLHGTHGSFEKYGVDPQEPALVSGARVPALDSPEIWLQESEDAWGRMAVAPAPATPTLLVEKRIKTQPGDYRRFYANVRDAILGNAPIDVPPDDGYRVIRLLELARQSSAQRCTLPVDF